MTDRRKSDYLLGGLFVMIAARGGNWLITPMRHPDATTLDYVFIWAQVIVCLVAGIWLLRKARSQPVVGSSARP